MSNTSARSASGSVTPGVFSRTVGDGAEPPGARSYAWLVAPVVAVLAIVWAGGVRLGTAGDVVRAAAVIAFYAGGAVLAITPGVAAVSLAARRWNLGPATALCLLLGAPAVAAMAGFWAWFESPALGRAVCALLLLASLVVIGVYGRRGDLRRLDLELPLWLALGIGLCFTGLAFVQGGIAEPHPWFYILQRYWQASDNDLPMLFATKVALHQPLSGYLTVGAWESSDRPPLQTGFALLQWPLWQTQARQLGYQLLGTALQSSWVLGLWVLLRVRGISVRRTFAVVAATALTGFAFMNTIYVWPKMLAGALTLAAFAVLVSRAGADRWRGAGILALVLVTLGMLAHGGTVFAVIGLAPWAYQRLRAVLRGPGRAKTWLRALRPLALCAVVGIVLYLPWTLYQRYVDPPGDRLLKWQLADVIAVTPEGALHTIIGRYESTPIGQLLANKWRNVVTLFANTYNWHTQNAEVTWSHGVMGYTRVASLADMVPAAGPLLLGVIALLLPAARRRLGVAVKPLLIFLGLSIVAWVIILWGDGGATTLILEGAYATIVVFIALCALGVTALPRPIAALTGLATVAWFVKLWVPGFGFRPGDPSATVTSHIDPAMLTVCLAGLALCVVVGALAARSPANRPRRWPG